MSQSLVTLGFRCEPELKASLSEAAVSMNLSLSHFVNELVSDAEVIFQQMSDKISNLEAVNYNLTSKIEKYESTELKNLFQQVKGQKVKLTESNGVSTVVQVNTITDLHEVITKSFKNK
jgi:hypothetical protein